MPVDGQTYLPFKRAKFKTRLPLDRLYTAGHMWLRRVEDGLWQVGLTRFAQRMLGEPVELDFEKESGSPIEAGEVVGWLEGFKAVSDLFTPLSGRFAGGNPALDDDLAALHDSTYERGWIFAVAGDPGPDCVDAEGYAGFLEANIDRMLGVEAGETEEAR